MALGAFVLATRRAQALATTSVSVGLALTALTVVDAVAYSFAPGSDLAQSPYLLLGVPLGIFALALGLLLRSVRSSILTSIGCAIVGLTGLNWVGGFVLMYSACSFHSGGC